MRTCLFRYFLIVTSFSLLLLSGALADDAAPAPSTPPQPPPPLGTPVDLSKSHDFAAPQSITVDGSAVLPGLCTLAEFRALTEANRYVYSFETWPLKDENVGGNNFTFPFHLGPDGVTDEKINMTTDGPFPNSHNLGRSDVGDKTSSPTHVLEGLGNIGWGGMQSHSFKFSQPVMAFGCVYRSPEDFNLNFFYWPNSPDNGYAVSYVLTDGTVVNLGQVGEPSGPFKADTNNFIGVIDRSGRGIVSVQIHVRGTGKGDQLLMMDDMCFVTSPTPAVAPIISLRASHDFAHSPAIASTPVPALKGLAQLADFRFIAGAQRFVYHFDTWPKATPDLGSNTADFQFDSKGKGVADQKVTITATSSDSHVSLTKTTLPGDDSSTTTALGGLGDIGKGGWAQQTFQFEKPVWGFGVTYSSPADMNLSSTAGAAKGYPVSYTLSDGTVVNLGSQGSSGGVISGKNKTFVGLVDQTGKGISSVTLRVEGTAAGSQPVYVEDLGYAMAGPPPGNWKMTLDEEFKGDKLDPKVWVTGYHFKDIINYEMQGYVPENNIVGNGVLTIKVEKRQCQNTDMYGNTGATQQYASGAITTMGKFTQTYGYFEARVKMTSGAGTWPAFWLLADRGKQITNMDDRLGYPDKGMGRGAEMDIFEFMPWWKSAQGLFQVHSGIIWDYGGVTPESPAPHSHGSYALDNDGNGPGELFYPDADTQFHTYGLYWGKNDLVFYLDSKPVYRVHDEKHIPNCPEYILLNVALSGNDWGKGALKRNPTNQEIDAGMPSKMEVDYVRVYSGTLDP